MTEDKYCLNCKKNVRPEKKFSIVWFVIWLLFWGVGCLVYLLYYAIMKYANLCPICKSSNWRGK